VIASYHNHTRWSDGRSSVADMARGAQRLGVAELAISDHFVLHPSGVAPQWAMQPEELGTYILDLQSHDVLVGLEVDFFEDAQDRLATVLQAHPFDVVIGSVHEVDGFVIDGSPEPWRRLDPAQRDRVHQRYWQTVASLARSGLFDIVAHVDLCKKFAFYATCDITREIDVALDAVAEADLVIELNTAGWHKPCQDGYPTLQILRDCHRRGIPVTLSADAHQPDHLIRDFDLGAERLASAGYTQVARFAQRKRRMEPLDSAH
jgi:histidinol-phosphatase (PHP family)